MIGYLAYVAIAAIILALVWGVRNQLRRSDYWWG